MLLGHVGHGVSRSRWECLTVSSTLQKAILLNEELKFHAKFYWVYFCLAAQHSNIWLVLAVAIFSVFQKSSPFPNSTCIDLLRGDHVCYGGYFICVICAEAVFLTCSQQHVVDVLAVASLSTCRYSAKTKLSWTEPETTGKWIIRLFIDRYEWRSWGANGRWEYDWRDHSMSLAECWWWFVFTGMKETLLESSGTKVWSPIG